jgi:thymidylate synthase ThyX
MEVCFPRIVLSQFLTHRMLSRSTESSRARPVASKIAEVEENPFLPVFAKNQKGMRAGDELPTRAQADVRKIWLSAAEAMAGYAKDLAYYGVSKQWANRLLEPFAYVKAVVTATDWENFFRLRCADDAQPELQELAVKMRAVRAGSEPVGVSPGGMPFWHRPYSREYLPRGGTDLSWFGADPDWKNRVCAGRCARVSYTAHDGTTDADADGRLGDSLIANGHASPLEHVATPAPDGRYYGNLRGWVSYRYQLEQAGLLPEGGG